MRLHGNLLQPSFKLREKTRIGARVISAIMRQFRLPPAFWLIPV